MYTPVPQSLDGDVVREIKNLDPNFLPFNEYAIWLNDLT